MNATLLLFGVVIASFLGVGLAASRARRGGADDHLLAGRELTPFLAALSAWSTTRSGFAFVGAVGFVASAGLSSLYLSVGWILGDVLAWSTTFAAVRRQSETLDTPTVSALAAGEHAVPRKVAGVLTIVLLGLYAAAQLIAGSKALSVVLVAPTAIGVLLGAGLILAYGTRGGLRAAVWTDAVQTVIMLVGIVTLAWAGVQAAGGLQGLQTTLHDVDPNLLSLSPPSLAWGVWPWVLGWIATGYGAVGQPHVAVRALALRKPETARRVALYSVCMSAVFTTSMTLVGLSARAVLPDLLVDTELALPRLAVALLPPPLVGLLLGAVFAATLSTADSQVLSTAASVHHDLGFKKLSMERLTGITAVLAALVALMAPANVFTLVTFAWSLLAATFGPCVVLRSFGVPLGAGRTLQVMLAGGGTALVWRLVLGWNSAMPEALAGAVAGLLVAAIGHWSARRVRF